MNMQASTDMTATLTKGFVGTCAPILGVITSFQQEIEWWARLTALLLGILVSIFTLISLIRGLRKK